MAKKNKNTGGGTGGESSLRTLVDQLRKESVDNGELIVTSNFILTNISNNIADMTNHILSMPALAMATSPAASSAMLKEDKAEVAKEQEKDNKREDRIKTTLEKSLEELQGLRKDMNKGSILDILISGAALLAGSVIGLVKTYLDIFKKALSPLLSLFKGDGKLFASLVDKVRDGWLAFSNVFVRIGSFFASTAIAKYIKETGSVIGEFFKGVGALFSGGGASGGIINSLVKMFGELAGKFSYFLKLGEVIGRRILFPIITIYDTVMGALDGFNKEGIFGAFKGAITGFINSIFGGILDLLKDGVSWVLNLFGFENSSKFLDSFSFQELIAQGIEGLFNFFRDSVSFIIDMFKNPGQLMDKLASIGDTATEGLKKILRSLLPNPSAGGVQSIAAKLIPDSVYEFAGMDPKTGAVVQGTTEKGVATKALENVSTENSQAKGEQAAKAAAAAAGAAMNSSSNQTVNNNTTQAAILKSKATNWEADDMWARGGIPLSP
jgi:hypothetical protein